MKIKLKFVICTLAIVASVFLFSTSTYASTNEVEKSKDIEQYINNTENANEYDSHIIDKNTGEVKDSNTFEDLFNEDFNKKTLKNTIKDENYTILNETSNSVEVVSNFATTRIIVDKELEDLEGAISGTSFSGVTILKYETEEDTEEAYNRLIDKYGKDSVALDIPMSSKAYGWGTSYMKINEKLNNLSSTARTSVAVIDTGLNTSHQIFKNKTISPLSKSIISDSYADDNGHGTATAGIISENSPNSTTILAIKALDSSGDGDFISICQGIQYAVACGVDSINISLGGELPRVNRTIMDRYLKEAYDNKISIVSASGNENMDMTNVYPAASKYAISVGAINSNERRCNFSNYGSALDFCAPGSSIKVVYGSSIGNVDGTSFACPYVTACVNLFKIENKSMTVDTIIDRLKSISKDLGDPGWDRYYGYGVPIFSSSSGDPSISDGGDVPSINPNTPSIIGKQKITPTIKLKKQEFEYTGNSISPIDSVTYNGKKLAYYTSYPNNNKDVGLKTAKVTIIDEEYEGTATTTFKIVPSKPISLYRSLRDNTLRLVYSVPGATNYEVYVSYSGLFYNKYTTTEKDFALNLTPSNKIYRYIKIRGYKKINGTKFYSPYLNTYALRDKSYYH